MNVSATVITPLVKGMDSGGGCALAGEEGIYTKNAKESNK